MVSKADSCLKAKWMKMPGDCFEPLTFGELDVSQRFIILPEPGDNGGLKDKYGILMKTHQRVTETQSGLPYIIPHGKAVNIQSNISDDFPDSMFVIHVE